MDDKTKVLRYLAEKQGLDTYLMILKDDQVENIKDTLDFALWDLRDSVNKLTTQVKLELRSTKNNIKKSIGRMF